MIRAFCDLLSFVFWFDVTAGLGGLICGLCSVAFDSLGLGFGLWLLPYVSCLGCIVDSSDLI